MKQSQPAPDEVSVASLAIRGSVGGLLMGLANLVPGISGGTMLVASGIYHRFINAIAEVTTLKFRFRSLLTLGIVVLAAAGAILSLAGVVKTLVVDHRWIMYAIFIGLTLGGVPVVWKLLGTPTRGAWIGAVFGVAGMAALALAQSSHTQGAGAGNEGFLMLLLAGAAAAGAMILPGVSGGYLLLVLGVYVTILNGVDQVKVALKAHDWAALQDPALQIVLPVGLGVVLGIVLISNLLKVLLAKWQKPTLGVLLGLLVGAVVGLWPFQQGVSPRVGDTRKGVVLTAEHIAEISPEDYPTEYFTPTASQVGIAIGLIVAGFAVTALIARFCREKPAKSTARPVQS